METMKAFKTALLILSLLAAFGPFLSTGASQVRAQATGVAWNLQGTVYYSTTPLSGIQISLFDQAMTNPPITSIISGVDGHYDLPIPAGIHYLLFSSSGGDLQPVIYYLEDSSAPGTGTLDVYLRKRMTVLQPGMGAILINPHPVFCWEPLPEAVRYSLQINLYQSDLIEYTTSITSTCYEAINTLLVGSTYEWFLRAFDRNGVEIGNNLLPTAKLFQIYTPLFLPVVRR